MGIKFAIIVNLSSFYEQVFYRKLVNIKILCSVKVDYWEILLGRMFASYVATPAPIVREHTFAIITLVPRFPTNPLSLISTELNTNYSSFDEIVTLTSGDTIKGSAHLTVTKKHHVLVDSGVKRGRVS